MNYTALSVVAVLLAAGPVGSRAALAPLTAEGLMDAADHVVRGIVVEVTSRTEKSKVERAWGIHRDRVYRVTVNVEHVLKGAGISSGDQIVVMAWQPALRIPPLPGLQGHEGIPGKGDSATFYLNAGDGKTFEPVLPNGIAIGDETGSSKQPQAPSSRSVNKAPFGPLST